MEYYLNLALTFKPAVRSHSELISVAPHKGLLEPDLFSPIIHGYSLTYSKTDTKIFAILNSLTCVS